MIDLSLVAAGGFNCRLVSESGTLMSPELELGAHLPGLRVSDCIAQAPDLWLEHHETEAVSLTLGGNKLSLYGPWATVGPDVVHLLYGMARKHWILNGLFPVHSVCIERDERGLALIIGNSGAGKTSIALTAMDRGLRVVSGNKTLVDLSSGNMCFAGGTMVTTVRPEDASRWPHLRERFQMVAGRLCLAHPDNRLPDGNITDIFFMQVNDGVFVRRKLSCASALHTLYPFALDLPRSDVVIGQGQALFDGSTGVHVRARLARHLASCLVRVAATEVTGSIADVLRAAVGESA